MSIALSKCEANENVQVDEGHELSAFLDDALRFVLINRHIAELAPLQLYQSALIFTPENSIVRRTFQHEATQTFSLLPDVVADWSAERQKLEGHDNAVTAETFAHDSKLLASASYDEMVRVWDAATGEQRQKLETARILSLMKFSSNGAYLHTNVGDLQLDIDSAEQYETPTSVVTLQLAREWVTCKGQDVLWLPHEYRGVCSAAHGNTLVVGQRSGAVSFFRTVDTTHRTATFSAPQKPSNDQYETRLQPRW